MLRALSHPVAFLGMLVGFLVADAISLCGTRVSMIAIPWLVLTTTGSAAQTGLVAFAELLPLVVVQALAGSEGSCGSSLNAVSKSLTPPPAVAMSVEPADFPIPDPRPPTFALRASADKSADTAARRYRPPSADTTVARAPPGPIIASIELRPR